MLRAAAKYTIVNTLWLAGYYQRAFANLRVPFIVKYHRTRSNSDPRISVGGYSPFELGISQRSFEAQIRLLLRYQRPIPLDELVQALSNGGPIPEKAVALTFDDGYRDNYEIAYPVLKHYGVPATFYICPGLIDANRRFWWDEIYAFFRQSRVLHLDMVRLTRQLGKSWPCLPNVLSLGTSNGKEVAANLMVKIGKQMSAELVRLFLVILGEELKVSSRTSDVTSSLMHWQEIKEMARNGMDFGSHTMTHPMMTQISEKELHREVQDSRTRLRDELGRPINGFVYPSGGYNALAREVVRKVGHRHACTSETGFVTAASDPYLLKRVSTPDGNMALSCREILLVHNLHANSR